MIILDHVCFMQKQVKYLESQRKATKARNEYLLCLEAANASIQRYFTDDLHDLITVSSIVSCELECCG